MHLKTRILAGLAAVAVSALAAPSAIAVPTEGQGNGAPNGAHFNVNIIGVDEPKKAPMDDTNRRTIFVPTQGNCRINLGLSESYNVADGNCFDGDGATFTLPDPDPDNDGVTAYSVYARALGKPGGSSRTTTCFDEAGETWCSTESMVLVRDNGKSSFTNVSRELLSLCLDTDGDDVCDTREFLFDRDLADYFWSYDNNGLKLAQLRFYEIPTDVGTAP